MISGKIGKAWGSTQCIYATPLIEIHRLHIKPGMECSLHVHDRKWNAFIVEKGELFIDVTKNDYPLTDPTRLGPGEITTVRPSEHHQFRTGKKSCVALEIYHTDVLSDDIRRKGHGGKTTKSSKTTTNAKNTAVSALWQGPGG